MFIIIGAIIVILCVFGGFALEGGNLSTIIQPIEGIIIWGSAAGSLVIMAGKEGTKTIISSIKNAFSHSPATKKEFSEILLFFYEITTKARKDGLLSLESHFDTPEESDMIKKYHFLLHSKKFLNFICDNVKFSISVKMNAKDLTDFMDMDITTRIAESMLPPHVLTKVSDSLPGLGIVAAVLGIVITMADITAEPEVLGHHVAVALVGTFLGILTCYGFLGPLATNMEHLIKEEELLYELAKTCIIAFVTGSNPMIVVEYGIRLIPESERPTVVEIEEEMKKSGGG